LAFFLATSLCLPKGELDMNENPIRKVLLTGGNCYGGVHAFAQALAHGFQKLGYPVEVIPPFAIFRRWRDLRDPSVLKILGTHALFAAPFSRRAICVAHGFPRPDAQGWLRTIVKLALYKSANLSHCSRLVAVSGYAAVHLKCINLCIDAVIHNPAQEIFFQPWQEQETRNYLTYVGRLVPAKNVHQLLPAMLQMLTTDAQLRISIVGDGPQWAELKAIAQGNPRVEFTGNLGSKAVIDVLRKTRVFVSGNEMEPFGITYLEALSQGCTVVMPACGGGLEIDLEGIGSRLQLFSLSFDADAITSALKRAWNASNDRYDISAYRDEKVAAQYMQLANKIEINL
jgi:glycosyltransferase involved in cell wall biosynthesis